MSSGYLAEELGAGDAIETKVPSLTAIEILSVEAGLMAIHNHATNA